ncbi:hypothetical protein FHT29_001099 [Rhizobium sp. SG741]|nr:hypothetical protein [Rhizobium sp. SG741]
MNATLLSPRRGDLLALFHPDYTVGSGLAPDLLTLPKPEGARGLGENPHTAGGELHPALRTDGL